METVPSSWAALCGLAFMLGLRHGFDADHLAVIDGLTRRNIARRPTTARFAGALFSLGHGMVVVAVALAATAMAARWRTPEWLETSGSIVSIAFLLGLAALNFSALWHTPHDQIVAPRGFKGRLFSRILMVEQPIAVMAVGVLFALSFDTISQAALFAVLGARFGAGFILIAALCFVAGMLTMDGLNGLWIAKLISRADRTAVIASRIMTGAVSVISLAVGGLLLTELMSPAVSAWTDSRGLLVGGLVIAGAGAAFLASIAVGRRAAS
ncbi:MAG: nickel transporter [Caulobacteraceae bacterium]